MICGKCGAETPAPLENCIVCSTLLPPPPSVQAASGESLSEFPTMQPATVAATGKSDGPLQAGQSLGRYRIDKMLGSGGMGHVYKAWDEEIGEAVALKVIRSEYAASSDATVRFKRELHLARQVTHKNVVRIYDLGELNGVKYISMPFIDGLDLSTMMKNGTLPLKLAVSIARQVAAGLAAAHDAGIVHRDLKPANIMVNRAGQAILMDFGLARSTEATAYTAAGAVLGTLEYMSPEQARGETASSRSDIYTLGLIYYEMFTGERPFRGDTPMSRLAARVNSPAPNPRLNNPDLPPHIARMIERCLERDPSLRYGSAAEIEAALDPPRLTADEKTPPPEAPPADAPPPSEFPIGAMLAGRYQLIRILGTGGMGVVYQAFDRQLTRVVALKTILPELAASPTVLKRFKQEVRLAQKINHKNIVRIFDMGEDGATKFITMDFIEGVDLKEVITRRGKLPPTEAVGIIRQVCSALEAAHAEDVTHRDLKPQNIMVQDGGQIVVMDFGIARSRQSSSGTTTDAIMGTPEYMSPEQARSEEADARSDIFSLGLIFYELLTGKVPFKADTPLATMFKRTQERAVPPFEIDSSVPKGANDIVVRCLETLREKRYQKVSEILSDLETFDPAKKVGAADRARVRVKKASRYWKWAAALAVLVLAVVGGFFLRSRWAPVSSGERAAVTVLIADFNNATGDEVFTGTLESMSITALEEAKFVNIYSRSDARRVLERVQKGALKLDETSARLVAMSEGISVIVSGSIAREGPGYRISARALDAATGKVIAGKQVDAANNQVVLGSVGRLVAPIRTALGDTTPESVQVAAAEAYTAASIEAAHAYAVGKENEGSGKYPDAVRDYLHAVELDPNLGRAYVGLAVVNLVQKNRVEAGDYYKKALALVDRMSEHEKYRTLGTYYLSVGGNNEQGIEALRKVIFLYPADATAYNNLSIGYARVGKMAESVDASRHAVELTPGNLQRRYNYAAHLMYAGEFIDATSEAERVVQQNPSYKEPYLPIALSALFRGNVAKAEETYGRLEKISSAGASMSKMGLADLQIYGGRYQDAVRILSLGIAADEKEKRLEEQGHKLVALAEAYLALGRKPEAVTSATKALQTSTEEGIRFLAGRALVEAGENAKAQAVATELENKLQNRAKALALMLRGDIAVKQNRHADAVDAYRGAQKLSDSWISHFLLGKAYVEANLFPEALPELEASDKRAGEATDLFGIATTTLRYVPPLYYWLGRSQEGMGASDAARKSYQRFVDVRQNADPADKLLADAKLRVSK